MAAYHITRYIRPIEHVRDDLLERARVPGHPWLPTTRADEGGIDPMSDASTSPVSVPVPADAAGGAALLSAVRASRHEGYDRVVFEFTTASSLPGYSVSYVDEPVTEDAIGRYQVFL